MANITYAGDEGPAGWVNMAQNFEAAGADVIELNMCCPNMSYNLELTSGGAQTGVRQTGASMGQNAHVAAEIVRAVKSAVSIPLFVKLTPEGGRIARIAKDLYEAGADAVGSTGNRMGIPPIDLDHPERAVYQLQKEISMSCHCGSWLKPLAQRDTYEIRKVCGKEPPIMAAGGIVNWKDAVEMVLCGGNLIGVCAETLISGYDIVRPMIQGMHDYMQNHGYQSLDDFRSLLVDQVKTANEVTLYAGHARIKDPDLSAPCKSACPHHVPVQAYVQKIVKGDYKAAYDLITGKNPLQSICSMVCPHPCEDACIRSSFDAPVKIRALKRFVMEQAKVNGWKPTWTAAPANGHKVAVIGAGLSGLACALELKKAGYDVTVFEKEEKAGGILRLIPGYAGHEEVLEEELQALQAMGVHFIFGKQVENTTELTDFEKVFAAVGCWEKTTDEMDAYDVLMDKSELNGSVAVIGSGFGAVHAARSAIRQGAEKVTLLWPGQLPKTSGMEELLKLAREEGVITAEHCKVLQNANGHLHLDVNGMKLTMDCQTVVEAKARVQALPADDAKLLVTADTRITNTISAITAGKNAAAEIDRLLMREQAVLEKVAAVKTVPAEKVRQRTGYLKKNPNKLMLHRSVRDPKGDFAPDSRVMTEEEAITEAARCLNCGCGEGCQLCMTICTAFAPEVIAPDTMHICKDDCVACGMCSSRCPNDNIEMVAVGCTV